MNKELKTIAYVGKFDNITRYIKTEPEKVTATINQLNKMKHMFKKIRVID